MKVNVVCDFDMMGPLGSTCPCSCSLLQCNHISSAGKEKAQPSAREKQAPLLKPHFLQNGLGDTAEANFTQHVICHICCNLSVTNYDFRVWPTFCTKFPYCCMEQFMQRKNKVKAKEAAKVLSKRVALFWKGKKKCWGEHSCELAVPRGLVMQLPGPGTG